MSGVNTSESTCNQTIDQSDNIANQTEGSFRQQVVTLLEEHTVARTATGNWMSTIKSPAVFRLLVLLLVVLSFLSPSPLTSRYCEKATVITDILTSALVNATNQK
jgi:hypothetical protein